MLGLRTKTTMVESASALQYRSAIYHYAESYHQQYLYKNPWAIAASVERA